MDDPKGAKKWCVILPKFFDWNLSCCIYFIKFDLLCLAMLYMNLLGMFLFSLIQVSLSFLRFVKWISFSILKLYLYEIYFNLQLKNACIGIYLFQINVPFPYPLKKSFSGVFREHENKALSWNGLSISAKGATSSSRIRVVFRTYSNI